MPFLDKSGVASGLVGLLYLASQAAGQCAEIPENFGDPFDEEGFGSAVVISADGGVALASGPGFDFGDGIIRSFERDNDVWQELGAFRSNNIFGGLGNCIAMDDTGSVAIVGAPYDSRFNFRAGAASAWERDPDTGEWSEVTVWYSPLNALDRGFGVSCAITPDGNTAVIGEASPLGTETEGAPDGAWVATRTDGQWGGLVELIPPVRPNIRFQYGAAVAISDDGTRIAVSAPNALNSGESGEVHIFERTGDTWEHIQVIELLNPDANFNGFGATTAFDGHTLLIADEFAADDLGDGRTGSPLYVFVPDEDGVYPGTPGRLFPSEGLATQVDLGGGQIRIRGDRMLLGAPGTSAGFFFGAGVVYRLERVEGEWQFIDFFSADEPEGFAEFGRSVAMADDGDTYIIGEPAWTDPDDFSREGRIHFPDIVFASSDFEVEPQNSMVEFFIDFPGVPQQFITLVIAGRLGLLSQEPCDEENTRPDFVVLEQVDLRPTEDSYTIEGPLGVDLTYSDVRITLTNPSAPAALRGGDGRITLQDAAFRIEAMQRIGQLPPSPVSAEGTLEPIEAQVSGGAKGEPLVFEIPGFSRSIEIDLGFGENNPSIFVDASLFAPQADGVTCRADWDANGVVNAADVGAFLTTYFQDILNGTTNADFDENGVTNAADVGAFLSVYFPEVNDPECNGG